MDIFLDHSFHGTRLDHSVTKPELAQLKREQKDDDEIEKLIKLAASWLGKPCFPGANRYKTFPHGNKRL